MAGTTLKFDALPNWTAEVDEITPGVHRVVAAHTLGPTIDLTGSDVEDLLVRAKSSALAMENQINNEKTARGET